MNTIWFDGIIQADLTNKLIAKFPNLLSVGGVPLIGLIIVGVISFLIGYFSDRIYQWDVGLVCGRIFRKLEETILEMER